MGRNTSPDPVREFLDRLADGIEALGQAEAAEVLNELRGHLDEAMAEAPGDDAGALAAFGNPERLAARILEERGVISGPTAIRPAPAWTRQTARVLDLLTWVAGFLFFGLIPLTVVFWQHTTLAGLYPLWIVGFWLLFSGVAACAGWWSAHRRQSNQRTSLGMRALGLRLVSMGDDRRLVKVKDLPGQPRGAKSRISAASGTVITVAILGFFIFVIVFMSVTAVNHDARATISNAIANSNAALQTIEDIYHEVESGGPTPDFASQNLLGPEVSSAIDDLVARRNAGRLASHTAYLSVGPNLEQWGDSIDDKHPHIAVPVMVNEYWQGADSPGAAYEYVVSWVMTNTPDYREGRWQVTSVTADEGLPARAVQ